MKRIFLVIFLLISIFQLFSEDLKKHKIRKIKYLSQEVVDEKVIRSYLGFREGDLYTEKQLKTLLENTTLRIKDLGYFSNVEINYTQSEVNPDEFVIFINLTKGFRYLINASLYWGQVGWKNFLDRDDYIGFIVGINRHIFESKHHFPVGFIYFKQQMGWEWGFGNPYIPFFPLFGNESSYTHSVFYNGKFGFRVHPDINIGLYFGEKTLLLQKFMNLQMVIENNNSLDSSKYSFEMVIPFFFELK
ncbi:MAG TPA: POTRA domain-containing protein, partial [Spirochaetota bacterium]|nr:POTRA domain-containing protein [Spirochaetota bacterium]